MNIIIKMPYGNVEIKSREDALYFIKNRCNNCQHSNEMWRCTGSWDNFMEAKTIDEAIEEFEKYYQRQLWRDIEGCRKHLEEATDNFAQFEDYRWRKKLNSQ